MHSAARTPPALRRLPAASARWHMAPSHSHRGQHHERVGGVGVLHGAVPLLLAPAGMRWVFARMLRAFNCCAHTAPAAAHCAVSLQTLRTADCCCAASRGAPSAHPPAVLSQLLEVKVAEGGRSIGPGAWRGTRACVGQAGSAFVAAVTSCDARASANLHVGALLIPAPVPLTLEPAAVGVAAAQRVRAAERNNLLVTAGCARAQGARV